MEPARQWKRTAFLHELILVVFHTDPAKWRTSAFIIDRRALGRCGAVLDITTSVLSDILTALTQEKLQEYGAPTQAPDFYVYTQAYLEKYSVCMQRLVNSMHQGTHAFTNKNCVTDIPTQGWRPLTLLMGTSVCRIFSAHDQGNETK